MSPMIMQNNQTVLPSGKDYWKSLDSLADTDGFKEWVSREFPEGASMLDGVQRRSFVKLMAASFGLAGLGMTGCRRPEQVILPYGKSPEELIPGVPAYYATSQPTGRGFQPLIVESHQGRPTKVEGNPSYLPNGGSTDVFSQASVLDLYDPDRAQGSFVRQTLKSGVNRWKKVSTESVLDLLTEEVSNGKIAVLANRSHSLLRDSLKKKIVSSGIGWFEHDAIDYFSAENKLGEILGLKKALRGVPNLSNAKRVLSLDCDFLGNREANELSNTRAFMSGRKVLKEADAKRMNRLYIAESDLSRTGGVADHRIRVESSQMIGFASLVATELLSKLGRSGQPLHKHLKSIHSFTDSQKEWVSEAVADLTSNSSDSVILAGAHLPAEVQLLAYEMNRLLGAIGSTINYIEVESSAETILSLASKIADGSVERLILLGGNPVYQTKGFIDWDDLSQKLKFVVRLGASVDESSQIANYHLGQSHYLECWDIGKTWDQTSIVPVQPLIAPLFDTISEASLLAHLVGEKEDDHGLTENLYAQISNGSNFNDFLRHGVFANKPVIASPLDASKALLAIENGKTKSAKPTENNLEVVIIPDFHAHDGQYTNNGWMQECPDPISKLTWDNALLISPVLAKILESKHTGLGLLPKPTMLNKNGQIAPDAAQFDGGKQKSPIVTVNVGGKSITAP
jgi:MoCo/4Fe-4S cofactor protein with predicted Tat translocation signal